MITDQLTNEQINNNQFNPPEMFCIFLALLQKENSGKYLAYVSIFSYSMPTLEGFLHEKYLKHWFKLFKVTVKAG